MKKQQSGFAVRTIVMAVQGALLAMVLIPVAYAEDEPTLAELTKPAQSLEIGVRNVSKDSFKAGEYNGLEKKGATAIVNFDLRGGGQYDSGDVTRWRLKATDSGLESRNLTGEYSQQGKFTINFAYDELLRNRSDSFMTPYIGAGNSNVLTLPSTWLKPVLNGSANGTPLGFDPAKINSPIWISGVQMPAGSANLTSNTSQQNANIAASNAALAADLPLFQHVNLSTKRVKTDVGVNYNIDPKWLLSASVRHEAKTGYKPMSTVAAGYTEIATVIADKIDTTTDQFNLSLGYTDESKFIKAAYYGSIFKNNVKSMTWYDWSAPAYNTQAYTMSSAPGNQFHQFSLTGGFNFSKTTKLVLDASYARNTQNDQYISSGTGVTELGLGVPVNSLNGLVITKAFSAKLTAKPVKDWSFAANYKYDNHDNRTAVHDYISANAGTTLSTTLPTAATAMWNTSMLGWTPTAGVDGSGNITNPTNINANRPYSKTLNQINLDATYDIKKGQSIKLGYDWQKIDRYCTGTWIDCVDADTTKENTLRADWRGTLTDELSARLGYAYSKRSVGNYNENAFLAVVPMAGFAPVGTTANGTTAFGANGMSLVQVMQTFGITGMGINSGYQTPAQLAAMYPSASPAQLGALQYYFGSSSSGTAPNTGTSVANKATYASGNVISELIGMRRFNMADRNRNALKAGADWQVNEKFSFQGGVNYKDDEYSNSVYGLQAAKNWGLNLDAAYEANENFNIGAFYNFENRSSTMASDVIASSNNGITNTTNKAFNGSVGVKDSNGTTIDTGATSVVGGCYATVALKNLNAKTDPCNKWSVDMQDRVNTLGFSVLKKNLMSGKLDVSSVLTFTRATTDNNVHGGSYVQNPLLTATTGQGAVTAFFYLAASALPTVTTNTIDLKINGKYKLDKASALHVGYSYSYMQNVDFAYNAMQMAASNGNVLPSNETAPNYVVQVIGASYIHNF